MREDIKAMQIFVDNMVGITKFSYPAKKNAPRPKVEFASIQLIEQYVEGLPVKRFKEDIIDPLDGVTAIGAVYRVHSAVRLRFRITVYKGEGIAATRIANGWTSEEMKTLMISTGYGYLSCRPISLEDAKQEKEWEHRDGFSVELSTTRTYEETINNIGWVQGITGYFNEGLDTVLLNIDINP